MRIQLDLDEPGMQLLEELKEATGSRTHKELFNNAITLLDWAIDQRRARRIVASVDETNKNFRELQMPALERAASSVSKHAGSARAQ
jgi:hypothetical protein